MKPSEERFKKDKDLAVGDAMLRLAAVAGDLYNRGGSDALVRQARPQWVKHLDRHDERFIGPVPAEACAVWVITLHGPGTAEPCRWNGQEFVDLAGLERLVLWWAELEPPLGPVLP